MKILLIGIPGAGKSTFSKKLADTTHLPLLHLDKLWHTTDYSEAAKCQFRVQQQDFMATHESWIIDGNYNSSWDIRLAEADIILWLKIHRTRCIYRVISRSLQNRFFP